MDGTAPAAPSSKIPTSLLESSSRIASGLPSRKVSDTGLISGEGPGVGKPIWGGALDWIDVRSKSIENESSGSDAGGVSSRWSCRIAALGRAPRSDAAVCSEVEKGIEVGEAGRSPVGCDN